MKANDKIGSKLLYYECTIFTLLLKIIETIWQKDSRQHILEEKGGKTRLTL